MSPAVSTRPFSRAGLVVTLTLVSTALIGATTPTGARAPQAAPPAATAEAATQRAAQAAAQATAQTPTPAKSPTPLLSVRRVPGWIADTLAAQRVGVDLAGVVTPAALGAAAGHSCLVVQQAGRPLVNMDPEQPLIPASNMKLLTAVAAIDRLGAGYRYTTAVRSDRAPVAGSLTGNLYLVGSGDPVLRTPQFEATVRHAVPPTTSLPALAAQVRAAGVTEVTGTVVGDETRYDTQRAVQSWKPAYTEEGDAGPLSALTVDDGFQTTPKGFARDAQPALAAAQTFAALLRTDGVRVDGPAAVGTAPATALLVTSIASAPLSQILAAVLAPSDDTGAELIVKELGRVAGGAGSTAAGTEVVRADLASAGLPTAGSTVVDGSGLDRGDRVTCRLLAAVLTRAAGGPIASELPVAGRTGTLMARLGAPLTAGRVIAKTGTLSDVSALSGFVLPSTTAAALTLQLRTPVVFSLIMDGVPVATGVRLADSVATVLAGFPVVPALALIGPQP